MLDLVMSLYQSVLDQTANFPQAQSALVTTSSMVAAGAIGFLLMKLPKLVVNTFHRQFTSTLRFNSAGAGWGGELQQQQYTAFLDWFRKSGWIRWSRVVTIETTPTTDQNGVQRYDAVTGPGVGCSHFFFYNKKFFWFKIIELEAQGTAVSKYTLHVHKVGRDKQPILDLMNDFMIKSDRETQLPVLTYQNNGRGWTQETVIAKRYPVNQVLAENVQRELLDPIHEFVNSSSWYYERGLDYKFCALLMGPPGTGKSSLAKMIAIMLDRPLHIFNPGSTKNFTTAFQRAKGGVLLIEDIDTFAIAQKRVGETQGTRRSKDVPGKEEQVETTGAQSGAIDEMFTGTLSDLLNGLQGVIPLDDVIILMTTNHPDKLDDALIRDSRVDARIIVDYLCDDDIHHFLTKTYGVESDRSIIFHPAPAATIHKSFIDNKHDHKQFTLDLIKNTANLKEAAWTE